MALKDKKDGPNIAQIVEEYHRMYPLFSKRDLRGQIRKERPELFKTEAGLHKITRTLKKQFKNKPSPHASLMPTEIIVEKGEVFRDGKWVPYELISTPNDQLESSTLKGKQHKVFSRKVTKPKI